MPANRLIKRGALQLTDRVAFITGGVTGLGLGLARACVSAGMKVLITYVRDTHVDNALSQFTGNSDRITALRLDVTDRDAVKEAADRAERTFGSIHLLFNNAGVSLFGPVDEATAEDWQWIMGVNVGGVVNTLLEFLPRIKAHREGGHIVNVASMSAMVPGPEGGVYTASKFAVWGMSECLRYTLAPYNIGVSVFFPGLIQSNIYESHLNRPGALKRSAGKNDLRFLEEWKAMQTLGMPPSRAAEFVLRGVENNDFYIFSHPDMKSDVEARFAKILQAFPNDPVDPKRLPLLNARRRWIELLDQLINGRDR
ncbi:MAG TPA: SDR family NAD(P)-dependent oxidoreductase [Terriglobia bacterium]|nr:SDR family NAD(P)-dependent oxidoreductase [Terriglobia bacterium]